jgi:protein phosphatase
MKTRFAGLTDVGLQREHNEDSLLVMPQYRVVAVADGMGGHRSGDVASQLAVSTLSDFFEITVGRDATWPFPADPTLSEEENYVVTGLRLANRRIFDRSLKTMADFGMGTTIVAVMFNEAIDRVTIGHVGDSRCYRIRDGEVTQLTRDHSLVSDAVHMAPWMTEEEMKQLPPNVITRALGIREDVLVDILSEETRTGDVYLLCSDGLTGLVEDKEILRIASSSPELDVICRTLIERANALGGVDNITVVLARVEEGEPEAPGPPMRQPEGPPPPSGVGEEKTDPAGAVATIPTKE